MAEITDDLLDSIIADLDKGDAATEKSLHKIALTSYNNALDKLPVNKTDQEISLQVYTALGDCYFNLADYENANFCYNKAVSCPGGNENGYVWLGLGQSYFELEEFDKAKEALLSAYMLEGKEIFEDEDEKYFDLIRDIV